MYRGIGQVQDEPVSDELMKQLEERKKAEEALQAQTAAIEGPCCDPDSICVGRTMALFGAGATVLVGLGVFFATLQLLKR